MMNTKEKEIQKYMKDLKISRAEAESLWLDDQEDFIGEEGEAMEEKAKAMGARYEQSKKPRKKRVAERKVDNSKLEILNILADALRDEYDIEIDIEKEVNLHFSLEGEDYSLKLTRHRKKK